MVSYKMVTLYNIKSKYVNTIVTKEKLHELIKLQQKVS